MTISYHRRQFALILVALSLAACAQPVPEVTPGPTSTPEPTATPAPTSTPTFTPTPTAIPLEVTDNLRAARLATPVPQRGAPCGVVDILDFPVGAPDGQGFAARWSFGRNSGRYNGIHAGEDWARSGGQSLGQPVTSVGHGSVTYAQPLGWGVDRGVVIVRHVFPDGSTILSFYGHLDPLSVVLRAGDCVARGDQVGAIGKPRGSPHLHFEIRDHTPDDPGTGYWPVDPRLAGWQPPSDYIWVYRIETSPGVQWTRPFTATGSTGIGLFSDGTLAALDDRRLIGLDALDGSLRWSQPVSYTVHESIVDAMGTAIYLSNRSGSVQAFDALGQQMWQVDFGGLSRPALMPLPGGGVVAHVEDRLIGLSASGERLWHADRFALPFDWTLSGDQLIFTTDTEPPAVHARDRSGRVIWAVRVSGQPAVAGGRVFFYSPNGIYWFNPETWTADLLLPLDPSVFETGSIAALPDGVVVVSHRGQAARRLIALNADGTLRWDRSLAGVGTQMPRLVTYADRVYAITSDGDILSIDLASGDAQRIFDGGSATRLEGEAWAMVTPGGQVLFDFRGGQIVAFDPQTVLTTQTLRQEVWK